MALLIIGGKTVGRVVPVSGKWDGLEPMGDIGVDCIGSNSSFDFKNKFENIDDNECIYSNI